MPATNSGVPPSVIGTRLVTESVAVALVELLLLLLLCLDLISRIRLLLRGFLRG